MLLKENWETCSTGQRQTEAYTY